MTNLSIILLYVDDPATSAAFYGDLFRREPIEMSPTFVMFALDSGVMLGLWSRHTVEPTAELRGGGAELAFAVGKEEVAGIYADWSERGVTIAQKPTLMDFGQTFVALDPDGHRLRVYAPAVERGAQ